MLFHSIFTEFVIKYIRIYLVDAEKIGTNGASLPKASENSIFKLEANVKEPRCKQL